MSLMFANDVEAAISWSVIIKTATLATTCRQMFRSCVAVATCLSMEDYEDQSRAELVVEQAQNFLMASVIGAPDTESVME